MKRAVNTAEKEAFFTWFAYIYRWTMDVFSMGPPLDYISSPVEAGSITSTVALCFIGGNEKRSLVSETVKYGHESQGIRTREKLRWRGPAAYKKDRPVLASEKAPHKNKTVTVKE
jgi:hypothetical protein